jgi:hypothetical protein
MVTRKPKPRKPRQLTDRELRSWIFELLANPDIAGGIAIKNMQMQFEWVKNGTVPGGAEIVRVERRETA